MKALHSFNISQNTNPLTKHNIPEDPIPEHYLCGNLKCCK